MKYKIQKRLKGTDDMWYIAFNDAIFLEKKHADEHLTTARIHHPKYEYKIIEWPYKYPSQAP